MNRKSSTMDGIFRMLGLTAGVAALVAGCQTPSPHTISRIDDVRTILLGMALFVLGTRVEIRRLLRIGARPLALGLTSWALIAAVAYAGVRIAWT